MAGTAIELPALPCPECRSTGHGGAQRIGNRRSVCPTCNTFAQHVMRQARKRLAAAHPEEYASIRMRVESDLYPQVIEEWCRR